VPREAIPGERRGGKRPGSGRKKGTPNKGTVAREIAQTYATEAIEVLRSVCADSSADETARVQAACKLLDLLSLRLLGATVPLPAQNSYGDLASIINGCLKKDEPVGRAPSVGQP
jgi:hypothetical protein